MSPEKVQQALDDAFAHEVELLFSELVNSFTDARAAVNVEVSEQRFKKGYGMLTTAYDVAKKVMSP